MPKIQDTQKTNLTAEGILKVANSKTLAGQYRQVATGKALKTRGGLTDKDIVMNNSGRYVSKRKSNRMKKLSAGGSLNPWWDRMQEAKSNNEEEFSYTNTVGKTFLYKQHTTKTGLLTYKKA